MDAIKFNVINDDVGHPPSPDHLKGFVIYRGMTGRLKVLFGIGAVPPHIKMFSFTYSWDLEQLVLRLVVFCFLDGKYFIRRL